MKKQLLMIGGILAISFSSQAQDLSPSEVPSVILNQFNSDFPKATDVEWEMDGNYFEVEFDLNWNIEHNVWYTADAKKVKHKEEISSSNLPKAISQRINSDFQGYTIDDLERITENGNVIYKMELESSSKQDWDVVMDANGKIISKKAD